MDTHGNGIQHEDKDQSLQRITRQAEPSAVTNIELKHVKIKDDKHDKKIHRKDKKPKPSPQIRVELQETLCQYASDTLIHIDTAREFCQSLLEWKSDRTSEKNMLNDIKERADRLHLSIGHVTKSNERCKALGEYVKSKTTLKRTSDRKREELEKELDVVLKDTIEGLEKLDKFADAVETLAVTSLHVFVEKNQVLQLPEGTSFNSVQAVITAAIQVCPLLLQFKREAGSFFSPRLHNVEVHSVYLDKYICITEDICDMMERSSIREFQKMRNTNVKVQLPADLSEGDIMDMLHRINWLTDIRMDPHFRVAFLFQDDSSSGFISEFSERQTGMLQFLTELEESAVKLDRMKKGAQISSVTGSSVGLVGGVLALVGVALLPVSFGTSIALSIAGVGMQFTSGIASAVTGGTEVAVTAARKKKANKIFHKFMEDVESLQGYLAMVSNKASTTLGEDRVNGVLLGRIITATTTATAIGKSIDFVVGGASALRPRVASGFPGGAFPEGGFPGGGGFLDLTSATTRAGFIGFNTFFIVLDIIMICKDGMNLAKGSKSEISQFIRARALLWHSELYSWKKIHDALCDCRLTSAKNKIILELPFYS